MLRMIVDEQRAGESALRNRAIAGDARCVKGQQIIEQSLRVGPLDKRTRPPPHAQSRRRFHCVPASRARGIEIGAARQMRAVASTPSMCGIATSIRMTSGRSVCAWAIASKPFDASPTTEAAAADGADGAARA